MVSGRRCVACVFSFYSYTFVIFIVCVCPMFDVCPRTLCTIVTFTMNMALMMGRQANTINRLITQKSFVSISFCYETNNELPVNSCSETWHHHRHNQTQSIITIFTSTSDQCAGRHLHRPPIYHVHFGQPLFVHHCHFM